MSVASRRLFVAIQLGDVEREACAAVAEALRRRGFTAAYEAAAKFHLTLAFLGNLPSERGDEMRRVLHATAAECAPLRVVLDKIGAFPHERKPRVVYAGAREQGAAFRVLAQRVRAAYSACGFIFENDPVAHVTIARVKSPERALPLVEFAPVPIDVKEIVLLESIFDKAANSSRYEIVERSPLSAV